MKLSVNGWPWARVRPLHALALALISTSVSTGAARAQSVPPATPDTTSTGAAPSTATPPGVRPPKTQAHPAEAVPGGRTAPPGLPQAIRWTENWSKRPAADAPFLEKIRHIPLSSANDDFYVSLGGEARYYLTDWNHTSVGLKANDSDRPLQSRLRLLADVHLGPDVRAFFELGDNQEFGYNAKTGPNRDRLDVQQAFVDLTLPLGEVGQVTVRPGRFEMPLGNGKLVGVREGLNVRYSYQGVRATYILPGYISVDTFSVRPVELKAGVFDDGPDHTKSFDGVYVSSPKGPFGFGTDVYWYDVRRDTATLRQGTGSDDRNNWGARLWKRTTHFDFDLEGDYQTGSFDNLNIQAWGLLLEAGYTMPSLPMSPRLGIRSNAFSGDGDLKNGTVGTFVPASPRLPLISEAAFFNLSNLVDAYPSLTLKPRQDVTIVIGPDLLWRESRADGVYIGPAGSSFAPYGSSSFTGTDYNLEASWQATKRLQFRLFETYFNVSHSLQVADRGRNSNYFGLQGDYRF